MGKNQATINIKYPVLMQDWHIYMPEQYERLTPSADFELYSSSRSIFYQNQLLKTMELLRQQWLDLFDINFTIHESNIHQILFRDFMGLNSNCLIVNVQCKELNYSVYIDLQLLNALQSKVFQHDQMFISSAKLTPMDEVFYKRLFLQSVHQVLQRCHVHDQEIILKMQVGQKEQTDRITDTDIYHMYYFHLSLPAQSSVLKFAFGFTRDQMELFFKRFQYQVPRSQQIQLNDNVQANIDTTVSAKLGETTISLGDLQGIQSGDVILLKKAIDDPVTVQIGEDLLFKAECGIFNNTLSVKLLELSTHPVQDNDEVEIEIFKEQSDEERLMNVLESDDDHEEEFESILDDNDDIENEYDWENEDEY